MFHKTILQYYNTYIMLVFSMKLYRKIHMLLIYCRFFVTNAFHMSYIFTRYTYTRTYISGETVRFFSQGDDERNLTSTKLAAVGRKKAVYSYGNVSTVWTISSLKITTNLNDNLFDHLNIKYMLHIHIKPIIRLQYNIHINNIKYNLCLKICFMYIILHNASVILL